MDLLDKAKEIAMTILLILQNPMPLAFCVPPLATKSQTKRVKYKRKTTRSGYIHSYKKEKNRRNHY
jgi:hypothetical protein